MSVLRENAVNLMVLADVCQFFVAVNFRVATHPATSR